MGCPAQTDDSGGDHAASSLTERKARFSALVSTVEQILGAADERDLQADARDQIAVKRDDDADLEAFTSPVEGNGYGTDLPARRHAALDRQDAKEDRSSAAEDRAALTGIADEMDAAEKDV